MDLLERYIKEEKYALALKELNLALRNDEYNIEVLETKAMIYSKLEDHDTAIETYNILINLLPGSANYYANLGLSYHHLKQNSMALINFDKAVEIEPDNGFRYASRAFIKDYQGDLLGALEDYNKAIELDPQDAIAFNNRGLVEEKLGRTQLAQESFGRADKIAGVNIPDVERKIPETVVKRKEKEKPGIKYYFSVIKGLLTSPEERRKFINFIFSK